MRARVRPQKMRGQEYDSCDQASGKAGRPRDVRGSTTCAACVRACLMEHSEKTTDAAAIWGNLLPRCRAPPVLAASASSTPSMSRPRPHSSAVRAASLYLVSCLISTRSWVRIPVGVLSPFYSYIGARLASVVESVDTATLKVAAYGRAGSSPAGGTTASLYKPSPPVLETSAVPSRNLCPPATERGTLSLSHPRVEETS